MLISIIFNIPAAGLGELRHTKIMLYLANRSVEKLMEEIENVLIKIWEFIFHVIFIALET